MIKYIYNNNFLDSGMIQVRLLEYNQFERLFWTKLGKSWAYRIKKMKLNPMLEWSEIMTFIKGSPFSYLSENYHLNLFDYEHFIGIQKSSLSLELKDLIWEIAQEYEIWKTSNNYFDIMDVTSYLMNEILKVIKKKKINK